MPMALYLFNKYTFNIFPHHLIDIKITILGNCKCSNIWLHHSLFSQFPVTEHCVFFSFHCKQCYEEIIVYSPIPLVWIVALR